MSFPGQVSYNQTESAYPSLYEANLVPKCIVHPSSAEDVASIISIVTAKHCNFAIKGRGHAASTGFANINGGVTIDMASLSSVSLSSDKAVASLGAGASWADAYSYLDPYNVQVAGGRNGNVGAGGLLIGGGISHFSARVGWSCDNVLNFEVSCPTFSPRMVTGNSDLIRR